VYAISTLAIIVFLIVAEFRSCLRRKTVSGFLFLLVLQGAFLHLWFLEGLFSGDSYVIDDRVPLLIFLFDASLLVGWLFLRLVPVTARHYSYAGLQPRSSLTMAYWGLFACCLLVSIYYFYQSGVAITGESIDESRYIARKGQGYLLIFLNRGLPLAACGLALIYFARSHRLTPSRGMYLFLGLVPVSISLVVLLATGFRAPLIYFILLLGFVYSDYRKKLSVAGVLSVGAIALVLFGLITFFKYRDQIAASESGVVALLGYVRHRVVMELPWVIERSLDLVDKQGLWLGRSYYLDFASALPGPGISFGDYLLVFSNPDSPLAGLVPLTPSLIGETFVNFGYIGVGLLGVALPLGMHYIENAGGIGLNTYVFRNTFKLFLANSVTLGFGTLLASRIIPATLFMLSLVAVSFLVENSVSRDRKSSE